MNSLFLKEKRVLVGLSGGVDSAVSAALLRKRGFDVAGIYLKLWKEFSQNDSDVEQSRKDEEMAREVAKKLGIEFRVLDVREKFRKLVVKYFLDEYAAGRTPNPCVFCNKEFKFRILLEQANRNGFDYIATGHYARVTQHETRNTKHETYRYDLFQAEDREKDQSYFLYRLGQEELSRIQFPLGEYTKVEVRQMAKEFNLPVVEKKESQDLCFVSSERFQTFLKENILMKKGMIEDACGKVLGEHIGLPLYTIGQRKGIDIGGNGPYYVYWKDNQKNILKVANREDVDWLSKKEIFLSEVSWISKPPKLPLRALVKTRYRQKGEYGIIKAQSSKRKAQSVECKMYNFNDRYIIKFENPQWAIASGQSAVFYSEKGEVLGGGIIEG